MSDQTKGPSLSSFAWENRQALPGATERAAPHDSARAAFLAARSGQAADPARAPVNDNTHPERPALVLPPPQPLGATTRQDIPAAQSQSSDKARFLAARRASGLAVRAQSQVQRSKEVRR